MAVERAHPDRAKDGGNDRDAGEQDERAAPGPSTSFSARGSLPEVAPDAKAAPSRPSASDLAYGMTQAFITGDIMYEQLAHRFAYRDAMSPEDHEWLREQGLEMKSLKHGRHGLSMMAFVPLPGFELMRRPVLAFRGTNDLADVIDDFHEDGVGTAQFAANEGLIARTLVGLQGYGKEPAVTGHSLGGALAQQAASRFPDLIAKVVTFQSPGISKAMVDRVHQANAASNAQGKGDTVYSHHYQVNGDLVGKTGEALTPGQMTELHRPTGYLLRHTGFVTDYAQAHPDRSTKDDVKVRMPGRFEGVRAGIGKFLGALQDLTNRGPDEYVEVWNDVRDLVDRDASVPEIARVIDRSRLSREDKRHMHEQLAGVLEANELTARDPEPDIRTAE